MSQKIVRPGRAFALQIYSIAFKLRKMNFMTRLNVTFQSGLLLWYVISQSRNSLRILHHPALPSLPDFPACMEASGAQDYSAVPMAAMAVVIRKVGHRNHCKELLSILFTCISQYHINFQCDNVSIAISIINKGSSKDNVVIHPHL